MEFDYVELGNHIEICRKLAGLTQSQLAEMSDLSDSMICSIENARAKPSLAATARIANALNTTIDYLIHMGAATSIEYYKQEWGAKVEKLQEKEKTLAFDTCCAVIDAIERNRR